MYVYWWSLSPLVILFLGGSRKYGDVKVSLAMILRFCTGSEAEPPLGFSLQPTIEFNEVASERAPTANTCINKLMLYYPAQITEPGYNIEPVYKLLDVGFVSEYFGMEWTALHR